MENLTYWRKQRADSPLFPDILWNKPERKDQSGNLAIIGGNKLGFTGVAESFAVAEKLNIGNVRALVPDSLKSVIPKTIENIVYTHSNVGGGLGKEGLSDLRAALDWSTVSLFIGDAGKNSETAIAYETAIKQSKKQIVMTRDAIDVVSLALPELIDKQNLVLVMSFSQLQKLFQSVYYPKVLSFSMQLLQLVEALHKFTITYPLTIVSFHADQLILAREGEVITQDWSNPMAIWRGKVATKLSCYLTWSPNNILEAVSASITES